MYFKQQKKKGNVTKMQKNGTWTTQILGLNRLFMNS